MNSQALANTLEDLIRDKCLINQLVNNLAKENPSNEKEFEKLYTVI